MESQSISRASMHRTDQWQSLVGEIIEIRLDGELYRQGVVDDVMPDASGLWIALEGAFQREFIDAASGFEVWTSPCQRSRWARAAASGTTAKAVKAGNAGRTLTSFTLLAPSFPGSSSIPTKEQVNKCSSRPVSRTGQ